MRRSLSVFIPFPFPLFIICYLKSKYSLLKKIRNTCLILFFFPYSCFCQKKESRIEITTFQRWDHYPSFNYTTNSVNYFTVKIDGESLGVNGAYRFNVHNFFLSTGFGYYRYSFNKIDETHSVFQGHYDNRIINYEPPDPFTPAITFTTDKYRYNTISINTGIGKETFLSKIIQLETSVYISNYFVLSSNYRITDPHPGGTYYKLSNFRYFGFSCNGRAGLQFKTGKATLTPFIILPVFDLWKQDKIFPRETNKNSRRKWAGGIGAGVTFSYLLIH